MENVALTALTVAWPPVASWLVLKLLPASITRYIEKEIDRRSDVKLEALKAELQSAYSSVKTSVDTLNASNSGMRPHIIEAVTALWDQMNRMREDFSGVTGFDSIVLPEEAQEIFSVRRNARILRFVQNFEDKAYAHGLMIEYNTAKPDNHRLFCGDRPWLLFYTYRAVVFRSALLITESYRLANYRDWRTDKGIDQLLSGILPANEIADLRNAKFGGLTATLSRIEGDFLHEATRVMSGSKAMADSLSDMQAIIQLEHAKVAQTQRA